jgi:hypothetical protein
MGFKRVRDTHGEIVEQAKTQSLLALGVVSRWPYAAERIVRPPLKEQIDSQAHCPGGTQRGHPRARADHRILVQPDIPGFRHAFAQGFEMVSAVNAQQFRSGHQRRLMVAQKIEQAAGHQAILDHREAPGALGVVLSRVVSEAVWMGDKCGAQA